MADALEKSVRFFEALFGEMNIFAESMDQGQAEGAAQRVA